MCTFKCTLVVVMLSAVLCSISIQRRGWLDRVVQYQKKLFIDDFTKKPPQKILVRIEKAPPGYVDSEGWDYESVMRLLSLIRSSEEAWPVRRALSQDANTRRYFTMSYADTFKYFPRLAKDDPNNFYPVDYGEYYADRLIPKRVWKPPQRLNMEEGPHTRSLIVVNNPVEAKLPSAYITVDLLKVILEGRAKAARDISTIEIIWPSKNTSTTGAIGITSAASTPATGDNSSTLMPQANGTSSSADANGTDTDTTLATDTNGATDATDTTDTTAAT